MHKVLLLLLALLAGAAAHAQVEVAATTTSMGMLARAVGGERVEVRVLAPPDRDAHYLEARPSMMAVLRRSDLLVAVGAELEVGWLPAAIQGANNRDIYPGQPGYFEGAAAIELIDTGQVADRAFGDVHPTGNPHYYLDPGRMAEVASALAHRLAEFDGAGAQTFESNAEDFAAQVQARLPEWRSRAEGAPGVVLFHKNADYMARLLNVPILGYVEPLPGVPPTARHLSGLVSSLRGQEGVVLHADFEPSRGPGFVAEQLGWAVHALPTKPPLEASVQDYFQLIDRWVEAMATPAP